jgi:hypothetical protein
LSEPGANSDPVRARSTSAAQAFVVIVLALVAAAFLNAQGLRKTAHIQSPGTQRNVSVWLTSRLADTSHFLYLDRPRHALKVALGRGGDDVIDTRVVLGPLPKPPATKPPVTPPVTTSPTTTSQPPAPGHHRPPPAAKERYTAAHPLRVWVAGDSLAEVPGQSLERITGEGASIDVLTVESRLATGLTRPDVYNWFTRFPQAVAQLKPRVAVLSFGADDSHDYMTGGPAGLSIGPIGSASWAREYRRRVAGVTSELNAAGVYVVWLGVPISRSPDRNVRFRFIDHILFSVVKADPKGASYIDAYSLFARGGEYHDYLRSQSGQLVLMRAADGIHYTSPAGDLVANAVIARLRQVFDLGAP